MVLQGRSRDCRGVRRAGQRWRRQREAVRILCASSNILAKQRFDIVLCWALDRFSREGMVPTIGYLQRLAAAGVGFHSYTEPMLSTDNEMIRDIVLAVMASLAKQERLRHVERIHAGIARARIKGTQSGKPIGRPWIDKRREAAIRAELAKGTGILKTARLCKVGTGTVQRIKREMTRAS